MLQLVVEVVELRIIVIMIGEMKCHLQNEHLEEVDDDEINEVDDVREAASLDSEIFDEIGMGLTVIVQVEDEVDELLVLDVIIVVAVDEIDEIDV